MAKDIEMGIIFTGVYFILISVFSCIVPWISHGNFDTVFWKILGFFHAVIYLVSGIGLIVLRKWAYRLSKDVLPISMFFVTLVTLPKYHGQYKILPVLAFLMVSLMFVLYLSKSEVKSKFT